MRLGIEGLKNTLNNEAPTGDETLRQIAKRMGSQNFFGRVCESHPDDEGNRYVSNGLCIACHKAASRKTYHEHGRKRWAGEPAPQAHKLDALWPAPSMSQEA